VEQEEKRGERAFLARVLGDRASAFLSWLRGGTEGKEGKEVGERCLAERPDGRLRWQRRETVP